MSREGQNRGFIRGFSEFLTCECDIPGELTSGGCYVEIRGRNSVKVRGCRKIVVYTPVKVVLKMKRDLLSVCGKKLRCVTYLAGAISVEGIIDSVSFVHGDGEAEI